MTERKAVTIELGGEWITFEPFPETRLRALLAESPSLLDQVRAGHAPIDPNSIAAICQLYLASIRRSHPEKTMEWLCELLAEDNNSERVNKAITDAGFITSTQDSR